MPGEKLTLKDLLAEQREDFQMGQEEAALGAFRKDVQLLRDILKGDSAPDAAATNNEQNRGNREQPESRHQQAESQPERQQGGRER